MEKAEDAVIMAVDFDGRSFFLPNMGEIRTLTRLFLFFVSELTP